MSSLSSFVRGLTESGRVRVDSASLDSDPADAAAALAELHELARAEAPAGVPEFRLEAALFGAGLLHDGCRFLIDRAAEPEFVAASLARSGPDPLSPENLWSVDLCLRYLPDLHKRALSVSPDDALVGALGRLAVRWPLSGIGIPGCAAALLTGPSAATLRGSRALTQMLVDRVLATGDSEAAEVPWISKAIDEAVGAFPELLPRSWNQRDG